MSKQRYPEEFKIEAVKQITERGLGNGASLIIFFSIVERMWPSIFQSFNFVTTGALPVLSLVVLAILMAWHRSLPLELESGPALSVLTHLVDQIVERQQRLQRCLQ